MKGFVRDELLVSLCGLNCALCPMQVGGYCPGCGGGEGNQSCALARCSLAHGGIQFCFSCTDYPCAHYDGFDDCDFFVSHLNRKRDMERLRQIGIDAYCAQLCQKREILNELLADCNDGRRKTFFTTAVYLLDLDDLQSVLSALHAQSDFLDLPVKDRALKAVQLLEDKARAQNISLKLRKKPKEKSSLLYLCFTTRLVEIGKMPVSRASVCVCKQAVSNKTSPFPLFYPAVRSFLRGFKRIVLFHFRLGGQS